jgi:hypothetical protein
LKGVIKENKASRGNRLLRASRRKAGRRTGRLVIKKGIPADGESEKKKEEET